ncbi:hypothetical protein AGMMS50268_25920 [Spirochaetia bacterium]|nr:hypothetical protein AGMMS50268_25920 [Spirochaetia bacterium]
MGVIKQLCDEVELPRMLEVKQLFDPQRIEPENIPNIIFEEMSRPNVAGAIKPDMRVAITCGSRGLANIALIIKSIAEFVKSKNARPFVVPAMGSHGGATAEGQKALIGRYGVTESYIGCPILSSMETVVIGTSDEGHKVRLDRNAAESDAIIVAGRIKPHTDFRGEYESGLMKMMTIGLGKREGATVCHEAGFAHMPRLVPLFGRCILKNAPIAMGFGIIENAYHETCKLTALSPAEIDTQEPALLQEARRRMAKILFDKADVLIVDKIGKEISGDGLDPNVSGASPCSPYVTGGLSAQRTIILDLTKETHGTAVGIGAAHAITRRLFDKIDYEATYINLLTARVPEFARIPCIMETDKQALQFALLSCAGIDKAKPRIIRISDTMHVEKIWVSEALQEEAEKNSAIEILQGPQALPFDEDGNLRDIS